MQNVRVAVFGHLPTACDYLLRLGVTKIDQYEDAAELMSETDYNLILIYAPQAEGLLNTAYSRDDMFQDGKNTVPIRLLNEPCCHSALLELKSVIRRILKSKKSDEEK